MGVHTRHFVFHFGPGHGLQLFFLYRLLSRDLPVLDLLFALGTHSLKLRFRFALNGGNRITSVRLSDNRVSHSICFLFVRVTGLTYCQLALQQALHKGITVCALQIEQRIYPRDPAAAHILLLLRQSDAGLAR